jgi:hypothetical protein
MTSKKKNKKMGGDPIGVKFYYIPDLWHLNEQDPEYKKFVDSLDDRYLNVLCPGWPDPEKK